MPQPAVPAAPINPVVSRRAVDAGAGAAGALAAVAAVMPTAEEPVSQAAVAVSKSTNTGGYQLTQHVQQYYATARV